MLVVIRHGQRADDQQANYDGPPFQVDFDPPLTQVGLNQAYKSGQKIKSLSFPSSQQLNPHSSSQAKNSFQSQSKIKFQNKEQQNINTGSLLSFSDISNQNSLKIQYSNFSSLLSIQDQANKNSMINDQEEHDNNTINTHAIQQELMHDILDIKSQYQTIQIITSPFLRCLQTSAYLVKGMGLKPDQIKLQVNWTFGEYMAPSFFNSWKGDNSPLNGLSINRLLHSDLINEQLGGNVEKIIRNEEQKKPEYPEHISQCKNRYRKLIQQIMVNKFRGDQNKRKLIIIVSHGHSAEEFMRLFYPTKQLNSVDYCAISFAEKKSFKQEDEFPDNIPCAGKDGVYGPWELKAISDATHIGLGKASLIQID